MAWFDIGVNLFDARFEPTDLLTQSKANGIDAVCAISADIAQTLQAHRYVQSLNKHDAHQSDTLSQLVFTGGIHPHYADDVSEQDWDQLTALAAENKLCAIGECGLDFNRNFSTPKNQLSVFEKQLQIAAEFGLGVYLHERDAFEQQVHLIRRYRDRLKFVIAHCFTGNLQQLQGYLSLDCHIGITGWLCDDKRGADLRAAVPYLPLNRLLLETDSPYLFPKTLKPRKSTNTPQNLPFIAAAMSELMNHELADIETAAFKNACHVFEVDRVSK